MGLVHHSAICVRDLDASLVFWRDGLGLEVLMDLPFEGDWPTLLGAPRSELRAVFLGDRRRPDAGIVELVDLGAVPEGPPPDAAATSGFLLLSLIVDLDAALARLAALDLGGDPRRIEVHGVAMAVVRDPDGVAVELVDDAATTNLDRLRASRDEQRDPPAGGSR